MARMRLRQRPARALGEGWVQPRRAGRWTTIGNLDGHGRGMVDPAGLVTLAGATWSLDWWIGAEDRWHLPSQEVAVRQSLASTSPVVETRLRVPSGDAVHRAYAARAVDGAEALIVEVENQSKIPFAVALALRPHTDAGIGRIDSVEVDGDSVRIDGRAVLIPARSPGRVALSDFAGGDSAAVGFAGAAAPIAPASVRCRDGLAQAVLLFPLAHTACLRAAIPLDGSDRVDPADLPAAVQVAAGWNAHAAAGCRIEIPDRRLRDAVAASTKHLLLGAGSPRVAEALDAMGFHDDARRLLLGDALGTARCDTPGAALHALARHWSLSRDEAAARRSVEVVAALVPRLGSTDPADGAVGQVALPAISELLTAVGEDRAARDMRALADALSHAESPGVDLDALLGSASSTWTWPGRGSGHDLAANAALVLGALDRLVKEHAHGLALAPVVPDAWLGQGWELHDAPTRHGRLSYAVRWHGDRPALLWHLESCSGDAPVVLSVPGLDPSWSSTEPSGDALLAAVPIPERARRRGLTIPVSVEPSRRSGA